MRWFDAFSEELNLPERMQEARVHALIADRMLWLWEDGPGPGRRSRCALPASAGVARINCVYTPPEQRGRRFGGAVTAACCRRRTRARRRAHRPVHRRRRTPRPNKVYERIGFRPVADHRVVHFKS